MKPLRIVILLFVLLSFFTVNTLAAAEIDLSEMSFDELIELRKKVDLALWNSDEWQEVVVPIGIYKVGEDIPEGYWDISAYDGEHTLITWGTHLNEDGSSVEGIIEWGFATSPTYKGYNEGNCRSSFYFQVQNGQYIQIVGASAVFKTYSGKNLGFK